MLTSIQANRNIKVCAENVEKADAPFKCPSCGCETILKKGKVKIHHFAHKPPIFCEYGKGESETHRQCKINIYKELQLIPEVTECELEKNFGSVISDIFFVFNDFKIAIEVQISNLTMTQIIERTTKYQQLGISVIWISPFNTKLEENIYSPKQWEKWIHATYFGRVYYWIEGLDLQGVHFEKYLLWVESYEDYETGNSYGGYYKESKRYKTPIFSKKLNLLKDFEINNRKSWESNNLYIPSCSIWINKEKWWK